MTDHAMTEKTTETPETSANSDSKPEPKKPPKRKRGREKGVTPSSVADLVTPPVKVYEKPDGDPNYLFRCQLDFLPTETYLGKSLGPGKYKLTCAGGGREFWTIGRVVHPEPPEAEPEPILGPMPPHLQPRPAMAQPQPATPHLNPLQPPPPFGVPAPNPTEPRPDTVGAGTLFFELRAFEGETRDTFARLGQVLATIQRNQETLARGQQDLLAAIASVAEAVEDIEIDDGHNGRGGPFGYIQELVQAKMAMRELGDVLGEPQVDPSNPWSIIAPEVAGTLRELRSRVVPSMVPPVQPNRAAPAQAPTGNEIDTAPRRPPPIPGLNLDNQAQITSFATAQGFTMEQVEAYAAAWHLTAQDLLDIAEGRKLAPGINGERPGG